MSYTKTETYENLKGTKHITIARIDRTGSSINVTVRSDNPDEIDIFIKEIESKIKIDVEKFINAW